MSKIQSKKNNDGASDDEQTAHVQKLADDKKKFIKKAFKNNIKNDSQIAEALKGKNFIPNVVSIPVGKRDADEDSEALEEKVKKSKKNKKSRTK
jgi:hypothetical protein